MRKGSGSWKFVVATSMHRRKGGKSVTGFLSWNPEPKNICHSLAYP
jgi:hypothetical protein